MRGIDLKDCIELFGVKTGFLHWFEWSFKHPIQMFWWLNISHKPYCTYSGFHCKKENCQHEHLTTKKQIKARWKEHEDESKIVVGSDDGICAYCGKNKGTLEIDDPNWDTLKRWLVCESCDEVIKLQREISFPLTKIERQHEINDRLLEISKETGQPIMSAMIDKSGISSVKFDGEPEDELK